MAHGAAELKDYPAETVRLACRACPRKGRYRKAALIRRFGPEKSLVAMRLDLAADCPKIIARNERDRCGVHYPDLPDLLQDEIKETLVRLRRRHPWLPEGL